MSVYRDHKQEEKINDAYKKILEGDSERVKEIKEKQDKSYRWTEGVNNAYKKAVDESKDMMETKCNECNEGVYKETSLQDDMHGELHCTKCGHMIKRHQ